MILSTRVYRSIEYMSLQGAFLYYLHYEKNNNTHSLAQPYLHRQLLLSTSCFCFHVNDILYLKPFFLCRYWL